MRSSPTVFAKGFRPFFLLAALFSVAFLPLWLVTYTGKAPLVAHWAPSVWHGHEMVFGFTIAVVAGFLLTAVSQWTGRETAVGWPLAGLCALWISGRLVMLGGDFVAPGLAAAVDLSFLPALAIAIGRPLWATGNRRNMVFIGLLTLLWGANGAMHLSSLGLLEGWERPALLLALDVIVLIALIIGGRIIPMFTRNATGADGIRSHRWLERIVFTSVPAGIFVQVLWPTSIPAAALAAVAGLAIAARMIHWGGGDTLDKPILWVLHLGHAWIAVGFGMRAAAAVWPQVSASLATHALTVGAIGMLTLGMMARVALGHTGRALRVARPIAWAFAAVGLAALLRTFAPLFLPGYYAELMVASGGLWALAFAVYLSVYTPILFRPRAA